MTLGKVTVWDDFKVSPRWSDSGQKNSHLNSIWYGSPRAADIFVLGEGPLERTLSPSEVW